MGNRAASGRELRLRTIRGLLNLMSSQPIQWGEPDVIQPYSNGYGTWFIGRENYTGEGDDIVLMGTAPLSEEAILERIEAREAESPLAVREQPSDAGAVSLFPSHRRRHG